MLRRVVAGCSMLLALCVVPAFAQTPVAAAPKNADGASVDAIIDALYACISGGAGADRQWDRFRALFAPGARLIPTGRRADGTWVSNANTPDEYITRNDSGLKSRGFFEKEVARHLDRFGNIVQLFSTYESRRTAADPAPFARGINSIQLRFDGERWWIVTVFWEAESPLHPLPAEYLPKGK